MNAPTNFYWIWPSAPGADGTLRFRTSGWDGDCHWSGKESFSPGDELHQAMLWVATNRRVLPRLLPKDAIAVDLWKEEPLQPLSDGVHVLLDEPLVDGWSECLGLPVVVVNPDDAPRDVRLLARLSGGNCFLFLDGVCEEAMAVGMEWMGRCVTPAQALEHLKRSVGELRR